MKLDARAQLWLLITFLVMGLAFVSWRDGWFKSEAERAMPAILKWGRLEPFPESARDLQVKVSGNMFTRGFRASFTAPQADIEAWLKRSPGTREGLPKSGPVRVFEIKPGGGAQFARVTVDDRLHRVLIRVYWS